MTNKPTVLFVSVHNAGRSQMAAGFMRELGQGRVEVLSAGSAPKDSINPIAVEAMAEVGIDIANNTPKVLTTEAVQESDAVITMGCGDVCPFYPGKRYEDWVLDDPAGQGILPTMEIDAEQTLFIRQGKKISGEITGNTALIFANTLVAIAEPAGPASIKSVVVFNDEDLNV